MVVYREARPFVASAADLTAGNSLTVGDSENRPPVEIHSIVYGGDCDVYLERVNDDGTVDVSILIDGFTGAGLSQGNEIEVMRNEDMRLRLENTTAAAADYVITGVVHEEMAP